MSVVRSGPDCPLSGIYLCVYSSVGLSHFGASMGFRFSPRKLAPSRRDFCLFSFPGLSHFAYCCSGYFLTVLGVLVPGGLSTICCGTSRYSSVLTAVSRASVGCPFLRPSGVPFHSYCGVLFSLRFRGCRPARHSSISYAFLPITSRTFLLLTPLLVIFSPMLFPMAFLRESQTNLVQSEYYCCLTPLSLLVTGYAS